MQYSVYHDKGHKALCPLSAVISSAVVSAQTSTMQGGGTPAFKAPEQYDPDAFGIVSEKTDMWALGCVAIEMLTGFPPPWRGKQHLEIMTNLISKKRSPDVPPEAHGALKELIRSCFDHDQHARPSAQQALDSLRTS